MRHFLCIVIFIIVNLMFTSGAQTVRTGSAALTIHNGLELDILYNPSKDTYKIATPLYSGHLYNLEINHEGCFYAIWIDKHNEPTLMRKRTDFMSREDKIKFTVNEEPGIENICILYAKKPIDIDTILCKMKSSPGNALEKIYNSINDNVVKWDDYRPVVNKIAFSAFTSQEIVPIIIEFSHETR